MTDNIEKSEGKKAPINKKMVFIIAGVVGVLAIGSNFIHPFSAKQVAVDAAKGAAGLALEKGKEKLQDYKDKHAQAKADAAPGTAPATTSGTELSSGNVLKNVESEKYISIDNLQVKSDFADTMLNNAIKAHDDERVAYLLDSGVNVSFTDNAVCFDKSDLNYPKDIPAMKSFIGVTSAKKTETVYTDKCSRMFLLNAANELNNQFNKDEFFVFNKGWHTGVSVYDDTPKERMEREQEQIDLETKKEKIFNLILAKTPKKDYAVFPEIFLNTKVPFSIRMNLLTSFLDADPNEPVTQSKAAFLKLYDDASNELVQESPNVKQIMATVSRFKNPWSFYTTKQVSNYFKAGNDFDNAIERINNNMKNDSKKVSVVKLEVPLFGVDSLVDGGVKFTENSNSAFYFYAISSNKKFVEKIDFQAIYTFNNEIKLLNTIVSSKKINLNYQDLQGNSVLHLIAMANNAGYAARPRVMAVVTRYLLNSGVNANLMNKEGKSSFMIAQESQQGWTEISKAYSDKNYN